MVILQFCSFAISVELTYFNLPLAHPYHSANDVKFVQVGVHKNYGDYLLNVLETCYDFA